MKRMLAGSLVVALAVAVTPAHAIIVYAMDNLGQFNAGTVGDRFIRFDTANPNGTVVTLGQTGVLDEGMAGLDSNGAGTLYAASGFNASGGAFAGSKLYTVNPGTGACTLVGSLGLSSTNDVTDMSWNPVTNQMQATTYDSATGNNNLYTLNLATGAATLVGTISGVAGGLSIGLATSSTGQNYLHDLATDRMYTLTGLVATPMAATLGFDSNYSQGMVMNWRGGNEWILGYFNNTAFSSGVGSINIGTGAFTNIATWPVAGTGLPNYETGDLAILPEPASLALIGLAGLVICRRRR